MKKNPKEQQFIAQLLGEDIGTSVISDFGLEDGTPEEQAEFITQLGENIMLRLTLEILKIIPDSEHEKFKELMGAGDMPTLRQFLLAHIPDLDRFIQHEVTKEYEATKTRTHEISQGINI